MTTLATALDEEFSPSMGDFNARCIGGAANLQCKLLGDLVWANVVYLHNESQVVSNVVDGMIYRFASTGIGSPQVVADQSLSTSSSGSSTTTIQTYFYIATTAFTGASIGDSISQRQVINSTTGALVSEVWTNTTTGLVLASAPASTSISEIASSGLTDTQLRASALEVTDPAVLAAIKGLGGGASVIDAADVLWWMVYNTEATPVTVEYYAYGTATLGTPTLPIKPYEYSTGAVSVTSLPATAATAALQTTINTSVQSLYGQSIPKWDEVTPTFAATTDTWVFKLATVTVWTVVVTYTDSTKSVIQSVTQG